MSPEGHASVFSPWNAYDQSERLNHADTIKVQWGANLQKGRVILSDMGGVLFSIVEETSGKHDTVVGGSSPESNRTHYGAEAVLFIHASHRPREAGALP